MGRMTKVICTECGQELGKFMFHVDGMGERPVVTKIDNFGEVYNPDKPKAKKIDDYKVCREETLPLDNKFRPYGYEISVVCWKCNNKITVSNNHEKGVYWGDSGAITGHKQTIIEQ